MAYYQQPYGYYPQQMTQQPQTQPQTSFLSIPNEEMVNTYPVAPGNCVTFKVEGKPIVIEKSMSFSQFDSPRIERYRIVKEDVAPIKNEVKIKYVEKDEFDRVVESLKKDIESLKEDA